MNKGIRKWMTNGGNTEVGVTETFKKQGRDADLFVVADEETVVGQEGRRSCVFNLEIE